MDIHGYVSGYIIYPPVSSNLAWGNDSHEWPTFHCHIWLSEGLLIHKPPLWDPIGQTWSNWAWFGSQCTVYKSTASIAWLPDALEMKRIWHHGPGPHPTRAKSAWTFFVISEHKYIRSTSTLQTYCCLIHRWFIHQFDVPIYIYIYIWVDHIFYMYNAQLIGIGSSHHLATKQLQTLLSTLYNAMQCQGDMASHGTFSRPRTVKVSNIPEGRVLGFHEDSEEPWKLFWKAKNHGILRVSSKESWDLQWIWRCEFLQGR